MVVVPVTMPQVVLLLVVAEQDFCNFRLLLGWGGCCLLGGRWRCGSTCGSWGGGWLWREDLLVEHVHIDADVFHHVVHTVNIFCHDCYLTSQGDSVGDVIQAQALLALDERVEILFCIEGVFAKEMFDRGAHLINTDNAILIVV